MRSTGFENLKPASRSASRLTPLRELFPADAQFGNYYAVLTQAYLTLDVVQPMDSFKELFLRCELEASEENLSRIRKQGLMYEGEKIFPSEFVRLLQSDNLADDHIHIRSVQSGKLWKYDFQEFSEAEQFFDLVDEEFGEFHMTNDNNNWYLILRDDDPILFISINDTFDGKVKEKYRDYIFPLSSEFRRS